tara:strand:+ start:331 stop:699 length:369 start_codon:yes stop_codon:yes gene_type:complete
MLSQDKRLPYSYCINSLNRKVSYMIVKYFTKEQLIASNENAIQANRNRSLNRDMLQDALNTIPDEAMLPVCFNMPHNDVEMRVQVAFSPLHVGWVDISFDEFNALPSQEIPDSEVPSEPQLH